MRLLRICKCFVTKKDSRGSNRGCPVCTLAILLLRLRVLLFSGREKEDNGSSENRKKDDPDREILCQLRLRSSKHGEQQGEQQGNNAAEHLSLIHI